MFEIDSFNKRYCVFPDEFWGLMELYEWRNTGGEYLVFELNSHLGQRMYLFSSCKTVQIIIISLAGKI